MCWKKKWVRGPENTNAARQIRNRFIPRRHNKIMSSRKDNMRQKETDKAKLRYCVCECVCVGSVGGQTIDLLKGEQRNNGTLANSVRANMCNTREFWWLNICLQSLSSPSLPPSLLRSLPTTQKEPGSAPLKSRFASVRCGLRAGRRYRGEALFWSVADKEDVQRFPLD